MEGGSPNSGPARALGTLYKMRWNIEVDFHTIKSTLGKVFVLTYDLINNLMPTRQFLT